jgi:hypothetical protein
MCEMQMKKTMKFCWKRLRHFVAAYFAFGLAATLTHSAIVFMSLDAFASEPETPVTLSEVEVAPVAETPAIETVEVPTSETSTEEIAIDTQEIADESGASEEELAPSNAEQVVPTEDTSVDVPTEPESLDDTVTAEDEVPSDITLESEETPADSTEETILDTETPVIVEDETVPSSTDNQESAQETVTPEVLVESEEIPVDSTEETDIAEVIVDSVPEEEILDSWPEERINTEPVYVEESLPPYSEARSTLETVTPKLDWLYTLRPQAKYTEISIIKAQAAIDINEVVETLETNGTDARINTNFCNIDIDLIQLTTLLAPGSDDTQPQVDADNLAILNEIGAAVVTVRNTWTTTSGSSYQCGN